MGNQLTRRLIVALIACWRTIRQLLIYNFNFLNTRIMQKYIHIKIISQTLNCVKPTQKSMNENPQNIHPTTIKNCWSGVQVFTYTKISSSKWYYCWSKSYIWNKWTRDSTLMRHWSLVTWKTLRSSHPLPTTTPSPTCRVHKNQPLADAFQNVIFYKKT